MDAATKRFVQARANERCEYCRLPQAAQPYATFHIDHVVPRTHGSGDESLNICLACERCNAFKGPNLSGIDATTGNVERLYDPRTQMWAEHFELRGALILGLTSVGRVTVEVLRFNAGHRVQLRSDLLARGEL